MKIVFSRLLARLNKARKDYTDNGGMTFVEVICAVAIFSLVTVTIGGIIVYSARAYKKGVSETSIQQEAQTAANNIGNIIKDACSIKYGEMNQIVKQDGEKMEPEVIQPDGVTELSIITNKKMQYSISYVAATKQLLYEEIDLSGGAGSTSQQIMAKNVVSFTADTDDFKDTRTIKLDMTVKDESTGRDIPMQYTMTSRNEVSEDMEFAATSDDVVIIFLETEPTLVPGETYSIPISVVGKLTAGGLEDDGSTGVNLGAVTEDYVEVSVPRDTTDETAVVRIRTKDRKADGSPKDVKSAQINIRRVEAIDVTYGVDRSHSADGSYEAAGAEYTIYADVTGKNFTKTAGASWENGYKKPQAVYWSYELTAGGNTYTYESDGMGGRAYSDQAGIEQYIKIKESKEDVDRPSLTLEIVQNMPSDFKLVVTATSKHTDGVNKANSKYPDDAMNVSADVTIQPRETRVSEALEITLEPYETGELPLNMKGGLTGNVTFDFHDGSGQYRSDSTTMATYDAATDKVAITLGKDEEGSGTTGSGENYTFTIDVLVDGVKKSVITVHVCRIDAVSIEVVDNFRDKNGVLMGNPTYDFRARLNVSNGKNDEAMKKAAKYLIQYKPDGAVDIDAVTNTLSSRITWELIDNKSNKPLHRDSVICKAGVGAGNKGETIGSYDKKYKDYYTVVNVKPARIEQDASGNWFLEQMPEIDISPNAKYDTGLPPDTELKVTVEMLHPRDGDNSSTNAYNKSNKPYKDTRVEASASIEGNQTLKTYTDIVIVEPGQGTNESVQSDNEMVIPIMVKGGAVYKMSAKLSGKTSNDTKLSSYQDKDNPYLFSSAAGNNERTWLLGLVIGKDEKGKDGLIDVTVVGKNSNDKEIATANFKLALRSVNEVRVGVANGANIKDVNKAGSVVTLEAFPKGYGAGGTEYFDIQRYPKDGNYRPGQICRWEEAGHGEYKSPLPMAWTMVVNGTEKPLEQWTEYIAAGTVAPQVNEKEYKGTVTFKLVQPLPSGTEIRATSLHTLGNVDGTKYNKSNKEYGKQYGALKINARIDLAKDCGFERYNEQNFILPGFESIPNYMSEYTHWSGQQTFYRYRPVGGTWSQYYRMDSGEPDRAYITGGRTGAIFRSDTDYELDCVFVVYNTNEKKIYWPLDDETLLQPGMGFAEAGYSLAQWDYENHLTNEQRNFQCRQEYYIAKTELFIEPYPNPDRNQTDIRQTIPERAQSAGTETNPIKVDSWSQTNSKQWFSVNMDPYAFCLHAQQGIFGVIIDKKTDKGWEIIDEASMQAMQKWTVTARNPEITVGYAFGAKGLYRLRAYIDGIKWTQPTGNMFEPTYQLTSEEQMRLYDDNGNGTIFVEFETQTPPPSWAQ